MRHLGTSGQAEARLGGAWHAMAGRTDGAPAPSVSGPSAPRGRARPGPARGGMDEGSGAGGSAWA